ncbi:phosphoglycerate mutase-like protein [Choiromyces venosus 120613-1]|uniref:Phosphoglycerate mutase-like protein n=1 Tax=Choiromyces venosus 120613-1 TaxID=1336337 RepID=A0A3N4JXV6_9PEZI|nr:phosphoglycerate mutase-like protein [Choiromyces venosus 120613-1]
MNLLLIRHGETVDNLARRLAGVTDSALSPNGLIQAAKLGAHLISKDGENLTLTHIYSSDLQRAANTAGAILEAQSASIANGQKSLAALNGEDEGNGDNTSLEPAKHVLQLPDLREMNFGLREGAPYSQAHSPLPDFDPGRETTESMVARANQFLNQHLLPALVMVHMAPVTSGANVAIAVVSHGIFLQILRKQLMKHLRYLPDSRKVRWRNTGYFHLKFDPRTKWTDSRGLALWPYSIRGINVTTHLTEERAALEKQCCLD